MNLIISRSIILTSLDLSNACSSIESQEHITPSLEVLPNLFRASTKNFSQTPLRNSKSSPLAKHTWKFPGGSLSYILNIGKNFRCKSFMVWFFSTKSGTVILSQVQVQFFGSAVNSRLIIVVFKVLRTYTSFLFEL